MSTINLTFSNAQPTIRLVPTTPVEAPAAFVNVLVGEKGDPGDIGDIGATDDLGGFTTDPIFYYLLASQ